jgi:hypothetical protein
VGDDRDFSKSFGVVPSKVFPASGLALAPLNLIEAASRLFFSHDPRFDMCPSKSRPRPRAEMGAHSPRAMMLRELVKKKGEEE